MKKLNTILTLSAIAFCITGCGIDIDEYKAGDPEGGEELKVTAQAEDPIILQEKNSLETAIGLAWTSGSNFGTGNSISYTLDIDHAEGDWTECYTESLGKRIYSRDITVEELNNIVTGLGAEHGTSGEYKGRIRASVTDYPEMEQYSEFSFTATSYNPAPAVLYITGDATEGGWDAAKATQMTRTAGGIFTFEGIMEAGDEFRFISASGNEWPAYIKTAGSQNGITYAESAPASTDDINFSVTEKSSYRITVNLLEMTVTIEDIMTTTLYLIGDATPGGWSLDKASEMTMTGKGVFTWTGTLTTAAEGFKFITTRNFWPGYVKANEDTDDWTLRYSETELSGADDRKFKVSEAAEYRVDVDLFGMTVSVTKSGEAEFSTLYMIGGATGGYSLDNNAILMESTADGEYTWTGDLAEGDLKFVVTTSDFWPGYVKANDDPDDFSLAYYKSNPEDGDRKFNIASAGKYTVTVNTTNLSAKIEKIGDSQEPEPDEPLYEALWLIGPASPASDPWSLDEAASNDAVRMNPSADDPDTYGWTGDLKSGELKISCDLQRDFKGKWFMPEENGKALSASGTETVKLVDASAADAVDWKWNVSAGNYTISINVKTSTMTVTKN